MKKIYYLIWIFAAMLLTWSCDNADFGDVNDNPNGSTEPNPSSLLANSMVTYGTMTGTSYLIRPTLYVQYQSQVTYTSQMRYSETPSSWFLYYAGALEDLDETIRFVEAPENQGAELEAQGYPANQIGVAKLMMAEIMKRVTDSYGDVPFSQAFMGLDNLSPAYDSQESIYDGLFAIVKEARDMMDTSEAGPTGDVIFNGDVMKWKQFANSLLMQMALQLSNKYPSASGKAATEFIAALNDPNGVIEQVGDEPWFTYQDLVGFRNPWFANRTRDYFLSQEFTDALHGYSTELNPTSNTTYDARLEVYSTDADLDGVPYGYRNESGAGKNQMSTQNYWNATSQLPMMTASYTWLNRAEAAALGWTTEDAEMLLAMGIETSYESLDFHHGTSISAQAQSYIDARLLDAEAYGILQVVAEEKWVSLFGEGFDAWAEWRRTEIPNLKPATDYINGGSIPGRFNYPAEESSLNSDNYSQGVGTLVPAQDNNTSKVWWDQE
ncbi:SusD/RagB family nutrient-binding outer membrane lipoprotein [Flagellimonas sp.]|jgi:hypothetical protein|uniref:SusD/RagB family nutrient-binding outer membrane lipoprotein n=1 Tax=Flagellimonas sp. TaxID=2058762 RepID=UPI003BA99B13